MPANPFVSLEIERISSQPRSRVTEKCLIRDHEDEKTFRNEPLPASMYVGTPPTLWYLTLKEFIAAKGVRDMNLVLFANLFDSLSVVFHPRVERNQVLALVLLAFGQEKGLRVLTSL